MAVTGGTLMTTAGSVGIEATDGGGDGVLPACGASRVQVRQALVEHPVHGTAVHVLKRPEAAGGLVDDFCGHLARGQCPQHMGHVAHDPARSGQSGARGMRCPAGGQGDLGAREQIRLLLDLLQHDLRVELVGGIVPGSFDLLAAGGTGQGIHGAGFEGVDGTAGLVQGAQELDVGGAVVLLDVEHPARLLRDLAQQVRVIPGLLPQSLGTVLMQGIQLLLAMVCAISSDGSA